MTLGADHSAGGGGAFCTLWGGWWRLWSHPLGATHLPRAQVMATKTVTRCCQMSLEGGKPPEVTFNLINSHYEAGGEGAAPPRPPQQAEGLTALRGWGSWAETVIELESHHPPPPQDTCSEEQFRVRQEKREIITIFPKAECPA